jgi:hypothetical protein
MGLEPTTCPSTHSYEEKKNHFGPTSPYENHELIFMSDQID